MKSAILLLIYTSARLKTLLQKHYPGVEVTFEIPEDLSSLSESERNIPKYLAIEQTSKKQSRTFQQNRSEESVRKDLKCFRTEKKPSGEEGEMSSTTSPNLGKLLNCFRLPASNILYTYTFCFLIITGGFNIDVDNETDRDAKGLFELLDTFNLVQTV